MVLTIKLIFVLALVSSSLCAVNIVKDLLQSNVFGVPVLHKEVSWVFDPDVGARRAKQFQALHGKHGELLIERLGLGVDGFEMERLAQQRARDRGHLGGLNALRP